MKDMGISEKKQFSANNPKLLALQKRKVE